MKIDYSKRLREKVGDEMLIPVVKELQDILSDSERYLDSKTRVSIATVIVRLQEFAESLKKEKKKEKYDPRHKHFFYG